MDEDLQYYDSVTAEAIFQVRQRRRKLENK